jgi:tape measure domain-containing protein
MEGGDQGLVATIDDKVVAMSFESSKFEQGVNKTLASLDKLKKSLDFPNAGKGLSSLSNAFKNFNLGHIGKGVDEVGHKLQSLRLIGIGVLANLSAQAVRTGLTLAKSLTLGPVIQGFQEYETGLNAVQTILSNTAQAGTGLKDVNAALLQLNHYADKTIYNFGQMTKNVGTFTAAGVDLETSVSAIKGISNLAAVSGSNAEQASTAMYQLSQALSSGTVKLQDWNSVVNAGMGGTFFQRALAQNAVHMGTLNDKAVKLSGSMKNVTINGESFRQSLASAGPGKTSWLTGKVLTQTLKQLSGDMTAAQLKSQGWTDAQVKAIQTQAKMALEAATQVKTFSQLMDTTKEAIGSGWSQTFQIVIGNFGEAKKLFTGMSKTIGNIVNANAQARNKVLAAWKKRGGRDLLIDALKEGFQSLGKVLGAVKAGFRDVFPAMTGKRLFELTKGFKELMDRLVPSKSTLKDITRLFRGLFSITHIGYTLFTGLLRVIGRLFKALGVGDGNLLHTISMWANYITILDQWLNKGGKAAKFFDKLGDAIAKPIEVLVRFRDVLGELISGFSSGGVSDGMKEMGRAMSPLQSLFQGIADAVGRLKDELIDLGGIFGPIIQGYTDAVRGLAQAIAQAVSNMSFEPILQVIRVGLLGGIFLLFKKFFSGGSLEQILTKSFAGIGGGILKNISGSFSALQGSLTAMQTNIKAKTLKEIAIAVALLAASIVALSFVDPKKLNSSLSAITIAFAQLLGAMAIMDKITSSGAFIKLPFVAASLIMLAGAIDILAIAVIALSFLSWDQLAKGLTGIGVGLGLLTAASIPLSANSAGMVRAGIGITAIAVGLNIMALAIAIMGHLSLSALAKGLIGVSVGLEAIAFSMQAMPKGMILQAAALIGIAIALRVLGEAVSKFGSMDMGTIAKGMGSIVAALIAIGVGMRLMPGNMALQAAGLLVVAIALQGIVRAVQQMGGMSAGEIAKGLISLGAALGILALALILMEESLPGAAALAVAAAGIALLTPALLALGGQSWTSIIKGMVALAGALTIIGIAAALITPAIPSLLGFGAAIALIGVGVALVGAGIFLVGAGLSAIAVSGAAAAGVLMTAWVSFVKGITENAKLLVLGLLEVVQAFADTAPAFVDSLVKIITAMLDGIVKIMPKVEPAVIAIITTLLNILHTQQGPIIQAGFDLLLALLEGIKKNLPQIVVVVADIIVGFLNSLAKQMPRIGKAGGNLVISFVKGIAAYYGTILKAGVNLVVKILQGIANNIRRIVAAGADIILSIVRGIGNNLGKLVTAGGTAIANFIRGIGNAGSKIISAGVDAATKLINALVRGLLKLVDRGARAMITFLNGIADAIDKYEPQMILAGTRIGIAIVRGMIKGLAQAGPELVTAAGNLAKSAIDSAKKRLHLKSPSKIFEDIGKNIVLGLANGVSDSQAAVDAAAAMSNGVIYSVMRIFEIRSPSKVMERLGHQVAAGLALGVKTGAETDVRQALKDVQAMVDQQIADAKQKITQARQDINKAEKGKKLTAEQIAENKKLNKVIEENNKIIQRSKRFHQELTVEITKHKGRLIELAKEYEKTSADLEIATNLFEQYIDQYDDLPEIPSVDEQGAAIADPLSAYITQLTEQVGAVSAYKTVLEQLKALGLDDKTYQMLLDQGPSAINFAKQILAGGKPMVDQINALDGQLDSAAAGLADNAAKELYDVGKKTAQGFVKGLQDHRQEILTEMEGIADAMVDRIKKKLKIKSPSQVFAEIGVQSMEGMAQGFSDSSAMTTAVDDVAQDALDAMRKNMRDISSVVSEELEANPVITPILDLTQVQSKSAELAALTNVNAVASFGHAAAISSERARTEADQVAAVAGGSIVKFEQNNFSPKALTAVEIYRQTKNQLSQVKSSLAIA